MIDLTPYAIGWAALVVVVAGLALYRKLISMREDPYVHLSEGEARYIPGQIATFHKLDVLNVWGKTLTAVAVVAGLALAALYFYAAFLKSY